MARSPTARSALIFEGIPSYPTVARFWEVVDKHKVNTIYTAPTAIRALDACTATSRSRDLAQS